MKMNKLNDKELLELLKNNVKAFNDYRIRFPNQKIDFFEDNLSEANLVGADLKEANLRYADFKEANLEGANLRYANLEQANLEGANLRRADLYYANLAEANLEGANIENTKIILTKDNLKAIKEY